MKQYLKILEVAGLAAIIVASISIWVFMGDGKFLPFPFIVGLILTIIQDENKVYKFLDKLVIGSLVFGFLAALLAHSEMYIISNLVYGSGMPFWPLYNPQEYIIFSLVFSFICFLGGLAGVVVKGFYILNRDKAVK